MNFKNINNIFIFPILIFLFSCNAKDIFSNNEKTIKTKNDIIERTSTIDVNISFLDLNLPEDYYKPLHSVSLSIDKKFNKLHTFKSYGKRYYNSRPVLSFIDEDKFVFLNHQSVLNIHDINNFKLVSKKKLDLNFDFKKNYPTSLVKFKQYYYASYSQGKLVKFNLEGHILWVKEFKNIIKTPLKIFNDSLILTLSDTILLIDSVTGDELWSFLYENNEPIQGYGGDIVELNHLLFFILPNNSIGQIDTIFNEKNFSLVSEFNPESGINSYRDKLHSYKGIFSYFDQNKYLTSIDIGKDEFLINKELISNVKSAIFFNNTLLTLNRDSEIKAYNLMNNNVFWTTDLNKNINNDDIIINATSLDDSIILFFKSGQIYELDYLTGSVKAKNNLKVKDIINISFENEYILIYQESGKVSIYTQ